jgi:hypothetical protein
MSVSCKVKPSLSFDQTLIFLGIREVKREAWSADIKNDCTYIPSAVILSWHEQEQLYLDFTWSDKSQWHTCRDTRAETHVGAQTLTRLFTHLQHKQCVHKCNVQARNHCFGRQATTITYSECVFLALSIQPAMCTFLRWIGMRPGYPIST